MNTPITEQTWDDRVRDVARRLETDRAIFRQALIDIYLSPAGDSRDIADRALQAAHKFEGEEYTP